MGEIGARLSMLSQILKSFSKKERTLFIVAVAALSVSLLLNLGIYFYRNTEFGPVSGGKFVEGVIGQPIFINPILSSNDVDLDLVSLIFSPLRDFIEELKPGDDHSSWTLKLKEYLRWDDGANIDVDDIIFTVASIQDASYKVPLVLFGSWQGVGVERISSRELRLTLKAPYAFFDKTINDLRIIPRHIFENVPPENIRFSEFNLRPIGNGPYKFFGIEKQKNGFIESYTLKINRDFVGKKPYLDAIIFKFFIDQNAAADAFDRRLINGLFMSDFNLQRISLSHRAIIYNAPQYYAIFLNQLTNPLLKDLNIRTALSSLINKNEILEKVFFGNGNIINGPLAFFMTGYGDISYEGSDYAGDKKSAIEILEKNGWSLDEDGQRSKIEKKVKSQLSIELLTIENPVMLKIVEFVKNYWSAVGIKVEMKILGGNEMREAMMTRNYQALLFGHLLNGTPDVYSFWHSSQRFHPGLNLAAYSNEKLDKLLEFLRQEFNEQKRGDLLSQIQKIISDDVPAIFLISPNYTYIVSKGINGVNGGVIDLPSERFSGIRDWYAIKARFIKN